MGEEKLKLSAPWEILSRKLTAFFDGDPDVSVQTEFGEHGDYIIRLVVDDFYKFQALNNLLVREYDFGGVCVRVQAVASDAARSPAAIARAAFVGNPNIARVDEKELPGGGATTFVECRPEVVQFFADNTGNPRGLGSYLLESIAREILRGGGGISYTTAPKEEV